ncbi:MAG: bifunctional 5,10-methylenetetrahydrofolate dehydrogenase/5,10-methenyltetrahydrofolate cyclohydrolase [Candidatus Diapherotrites archaeon]|nr:bifunctional 5,10-methylenetetrahydrofolate dehydrogenase/5,10-methenyltetrahydrofolate cyclohydrolase [Candidatus Diapherotrites archaeon]
MKGRLMNGKILSHKILSRVRKHVRQFRKKNGFVPRLCVVQVGHDPASSLYVSKKMAAAEAVGIRSERIHLPVRVSRKEFLQVMDRLNQDEFIHGILLQLPLPPHLRSLPVMELVRTEKDVDGFHPFNQGRNLLGKTDLVACTPKGVMALLDHYKVRLKGLRAVVVGTSDIVGKPLGLMLLNAGATVSSCNVFTRDLTSFTREADLLCSATGVPHLIKAEMVKPGAVVVDIGISKKDGKTVGDVDFDSVRPRVRLITPVPGGVGPMTVACLMENTLLAAQRQVRK